jgi:hypothetical protein
MGGFVMHNNRRRWGPAFMRALLSLAGVAMVGFLLAGVLLSSPAAAPHTVDAVVVLGGDGRLSLERYARGRDLVLAGYSKRLILFYPSADDLRDASARVPEVEVVACMPAPGTWGEAKVVSERMQAEGMRSVMVVSDPPHMLRLRYTWGSILRGTGLHYTLGRHHPALVAGLALVGQPGGRAICGWRGAEAGAIAWRSTGLGGEAIP